MSTHTITAPIPTYAHRTLHRSCPAPAPASVPHDHDHDNPSPPARPVHRPRTTRSGGREGGQERWFEFHPLHHPAPRRVSDFAVHLQDVIDMIDKDPGESEGVGEREREGEGKKMSDFETPAGSPASSPVFRTSSSSSFGFVSRPSQLGLTSVVSEEEEAGGVEEGVPAERKDDDVAKHADTEPEAVTDGGKAVQPFKNSAPRVPSPPRLSAFRRRAATLPSTPQFLASRQTQTQIHRPHAPPPLCPLPTRPIFKQEAFKTAEDKVHNYIKHYQTRPWTEMEEAPDYFLFGWRNEVIASWNRFYSKENEAKRRAVRGSVSLPG
ncbi:hypothetical protein L202_05100 [Cryptococcus amylolentus CBS 6039]|uniref:Uncharacterized protein n=2 Tax=Cryptococcus amylolentus TaxID=104669 RepID=A0A1E3HPE5_9TREE|nr:hypothetical protein L202_05100 [Cryptococcus amylolentus CBS 6039]ODN78015.1 hypothetical protein L202_05100 [Cryptococcus amylolentus CBS 6039]ODO05963.1 hypothetical protein I350_05024 [Cryptococcus amylolentus CBS 6273]